MAELEVMRAIRRVPVWMLSILVDALKGTRSSVLVSVRFITRAEQLSGEL
jgi:hypothetical protein